MLQSPTANIFDVFSKGPLFNQDNADFLMTRSTLIRKLRSLDDLADMYPSNKSIEASKQLFLEFMGQLVQDKNTDIAASIHEFLNQARLDLKSKTAHQGSFEDESYFIATDLVYSFLTGTGLKGKIIAYLGTGRNGAINQVNAEIKEIHAMTQVLQALLKMDIFDTSFHIDNYSPYHQTENKARAPFVEFCSSVTHKASTAKSVPLKTETQTNSKEVDHSSLGEILSRFSISSKPTTPKPHFDAKKRLERSQSLRHYVRTDKLNTLQSTPSIKQRVSTQSILKQFEKYSGSSFNVDNSATENFQPILQHIQEKQKKPSV